MITGQVCAQDLMKNWNNIVIQLKSRDIRCYLFYEWHLLDNVHQLEMKSPFNIIILKISGLMKSWIKIQNRINIDYGIYKNLHFSIFVTVYLHLRHAFWHLRRTSEFLWQWGLNLEHLRVGQMLAQPALQVAQHWVCHFGLLHHPFILMTRHLFLLLEFQQPVESKNWKLTWYGSKEKYEKCNTTILIMIS